jgi:hypothetical protein
MQDYLNRGWTIATFKEHIGEINELRDKLEATKDKLEFERDRRYMEVNIEREKALKIKEEADKAALGLAREIQTYKDEKANQLREQINQERGHYASREDLQSAMREIDATLRPLVGTRREGTNITISTLFVVAGLALTAGALLVNLFHQTAIQPPAALIPGQSGTQTTPISPK